MLDPSLIVAEDGGLKNVFVYLYLARNEEPDVHESYEETADAVVELDNDKCRFKPYALFVRTSQTLRMKNSDSVGHNCHIALFNNAVNQNIPSGEHVDVQLEEPERVPGNVKCDIHKWMHGIILVRDNPYAAITDENGDFVIKNLPAGKWKFQFWHKLPGYLKKMHDENGDALDSGRRGEVEFEVKSGEILDLGELTIAVDVFEIDEDD